MATISNAVFAMERSVQINPPGSRIAYQKDGKKLVAQKGPQMNIILTRYNADGSVDTTFGQTGIAESPDIREYQITKFFIRDILIQPDGTIFIEISGAHQVGDMTKYKVTYNPKNDQWEIAHIGKFKVRPLKPIEPPVPVYQVG